MAHSAVRPTTEIRATARGRRRHTQLAERQARLAWLLLLPTIVVLAFIAVYPLGRTLYDSFTNARLGGTRPTHGVGLRNYQDLLHDSLFRHSIWVSIKFAVITVIFEFVLGTLIALVVNSNFKGRGLMRAAMLIPWAIITVVSAQMWKWMYNDVYGVVDDLLVRRLHILDHNIAWVAQPNTSLGAICAVDIWKTTPFVALLLLAGLQTIPADVYEAARIDGAGPFRRFFSITLPLLRPAILVTLIFRTLDALRVFDAFFVMFGARADTQTMAIYDQQNIVAFSNIGYGAAVSVAIFVIIGVFVVAYVTFLKVDEA